MNKAAPVIVAPIVGILMFVAMAATQSVGFEYRTASSERQQRYLSAIAKGFERGFMATAGDNAVIERMSANANWDSISIEARLTQNEVERATEEQIADFRDFTFRQSCAYFAEKALFETGIVLKIRVKKPSGDTLTTFAINDEGCAPYRSVAAGQDEG